MNVASHNHFFSVEALLSMLWTGKAREMMLSMFVVEWEDERHHTTLPEKVVLEATEPRQQQRTLGCGQGAEGGREVKAALQCGSTSPQRPDELPKADREKDYLLILGPQADTHTPIPAVQVA